MAIKGDSGTIFRNGMAYTPRNADFDKQSGRFPIDLLEGLQEK